LVSRPGLSFGSGGKRGINRGSGRAEDSLHELVVINLYPAVAVGVEPLEGLGEGLDDDARADEAVERDARRRATREGGRGGVGF
jgi:hypothetical protein